MALPRQTVHELPCSIRGSVVADDNAHALTSQRPANALANPSRASCDDSYGLFVRRFHRLGHLSSVTADAQVRLLLVRRKSFECAQTRAIFTHHYGGFVGEHALVRASLDEFSYPQPARVARRPHGWQSMVRADHFVSIRHVRAMPEKQRAKVGQALQEVFRIARKHLHVFGGNAVSLLNHFVESIA